MTPKPTIEVEANFLRPEDGGRTHPPFFSSECRYLPHLVVQPPDIRKATYQDGYGNEDYLGVAFVSGPAQYVVGQPGCFVVELGFYPDVDYSALQEGATFTVREGARVVGFGKVLPSRNTCPEKP